MDGQQRVVTAGAMGNAVRFDPQFTVPTRPRFPRELVVVPFADGLLVDGTDELQVLRGQATKTLLPRLMPLLDGTRTLDALTTALPDVPAPHLQQAIALLYTRGLIEEGGDDPQAAEPFDEQILAFLRRHVDTTRVNRSAWSAARRLQQGQVDVFALAADDVRALLVDQLRAAGVGTVTTRRFGEPLSVDSAEGARFAVALVDGCDDPAQLAALDRECARHGVPWLRVAIDAAGQTADLGPYFERGETACYACFRRVDNVVRTEARMRPTRGDSALDTRLWVDMLVLEVVALLSRVLPAATGLATKRYDLTTWTSRTLHFPSVPGCSHCRPIPGVDETLPTALLYENAIRFPSRHLLDPKQHQAHYRASNAELALDGKRYPSVVRVALPDPAGLTSLAGATLDHVAPGTAPASSALDVAALASLLLFGAGLRRGEATPGKTVTPKRWAATGGNLGSVELYVAVSAVAGLPAGLYFYQPHEHVLARIDPGLTRGGVATLLARALGTEDGRAPGAAIVATAALHRVAQKYGAFSYRIANLDGGVALAQMRTVGSSLGLRTHIARDWDDELIAEHLGLRDLSEPVTGVLLVHGRSRREGGVE